jgi:hypothetical protein
MVFKHISTVSIFCLQDIFTSADSKEIPDKDIRVDYFPVIFMSLANYIPAQQLHAGVLMKLAKQCMQFRKQLKLRQGGKVANWVDWLQPQCDMNVSIIAPSSIIDTGLQTVVVVHGHC